jgi:uncharacterized membrane protein YfhO
VGILDFDSERIAWVITDDAQDRYITLAVSYHPNWRAWHNGAPIPIRETEDHLMEVQIPRGTSTLTLVFRRAWWETLLVVISISAIGVSLSLWLRGRRPGRTN